MSCLNFRLESTSGLLSSIILAFLLSIIINIFLLKKFRLIIPKALLFYVLGFFVFWCVGAFSALRMEVFEYNLFSIPIRFFVYFSVSLSVVFILTSALGLDFYESVFVFLKLIVIVYFLHSLVIFIQFLDPGFRDFLYGVFDVGKTSTSPVSSFRLGGITGRLPGLSYSHGIACLFSLYLYSVRGSIKYIFAYFVILFSLIFVARTGIFFGIFSIFIYVFLKNKYFFKSLLLILFTFFLVASSIWSFGGKISNDAEQAVSRTFEIFEVTSRSGKFETASTNDLLDNHWSVVPEETLEILFGYGAADSAFVGFHNTDVGFLRVVFFSGIVGLVLVVVIHCFIFLYLVKGVDRSFFALVLFFAIFWFSFNSKDYEIFGGPSLLVLLVLALLKSAGQFNLTSRFKETRQ